MNVEANGHPEFHRDQSFHPGNRDNSKVKYFDPEGIVYSHILAGNFSSLGNEPWTFPSNSNEERFWEELDLQKFDDPDIWTFDYSGDDRLLLDTIFSDSFQNLRGKAQHDLINYFRDWPNTSRFEHVLDTVFLSRMIRSEAEKEGITIDYPLDKLAAVHDIGHGAGSHWSEQAVGGNYDLHEERIKYVLEEEGLVDEFRQIKGGKQALEANFPALLKQPKPDLNIDRLAYIIRDAYHLKMGSNLPFQSPMGEQDEVLEGFNWEKIGEILSSVEVHEEEIEGEKHQRLVMDDEEVARHVSELYIDLESNLYFNPATEILKEVFADAARLSINNGKMTVGELFKLPDYAVMEQIASDEEAREYIDRAFDSLIYGDSLEIVGDKDEEYDVEVNLRRDYVDPLVKKEGETISEMKRTSDLTDLDDLIEQHRGDITLRAKLRGWEYEPVELDEPVESWAEVVEREETPRVRHDFEQDLGDYWNSRMLELYGIERGSA